MHTGAQSEGALTKCLTCVFPDVYFNLGSCLAAGPHLNTTPSKPVFLNLAHWNTSVDPNDISRGPQVKNHVRRGQEKKKAGPKGTS